MSKVIVPRVRNERDKNQFDVFVCKYINNLDPRLTDINSKIGLNSKIKKGNTQPISGCCDL